MTTNETMLLASSLLFFGLWLSSLLSVSRLKNVLRTGLRKAEEDNADRVRIPYNQLAELLGWKAEFKRYKFERTPGRKARGSTHVRTSHYPARGVQR